MKALIRKVAAPTYDALLEAVADALHAITAQDAASHFGVNTPGNSVAAAQAHDRLADSRHRAEK
jgi:hypothetical protein